jgi:hypothetical protein
MFSCILRFMYTPKQYYVDGDIRIPLGFWVRKMIGGTYNYKYDRKNGRIGKCGRSYLPGTVWRVRRGNGILGAEVGVHYQDRFTGVVPSSINNPEGEPYREKLRAAVLAWQNLSEAEKKTWHTKSIDDKFRTGYNLFIQNYMLSM